MKKGKLYHFDVSGPFPQFTHDEDTIGDINTKIEKSIRLCTDRGRIISNNYRFTGAPSFADRNPLDEDFIKDYLSLFKKLRMCFSFSSLKAFYDLTWGIDDFDKLPVGDKGFLKLLEIPVAKKGVAKSGNKYYDLEHAPTIHLLRHQIDYLRRHSNDYEELAKIVGTLKDFVAKRRRLDGYYIKRLYGDFESKRVHRIDPRVYFEQDDLGIPHTHINGFTFVDLDWVLNNTDYNREDFDGKIWDVALYGEGVPLIEIISLSPPEKHWYRREGMRNGPLYPSILFPEEDTSVPHIPPRNG